MGSHSWRGWLLPVVLLGVLVPAGLQAQTQWWIPTTVGYGGLGLGAGLLALGVSDVSLDNEGAMVMALVGGPIVGGLIGLRIGSTADRALASGEELSPRHRTAVRAGSVLAGGVGGAAIGAVLVNADRDRSEPSRGRSGTIVAGSVLAGAAGGLLVQRSLDSKLWPASSAVVALDLTRYGEPGVLVRVGY
jgi:hypothetical protein